MTIQSSSLLQCSGRHGVRNCKHYSTCFCLLREMRCLLPSSPVIDGIQSILKHYSVGSFSKQWAAHLDIVPNGKINVVDTKLFPLLHISFLIKFRANLGQLQITQISYCILIIQLPRTTRSNCFSGEFQLAETLITAACGITHKDPVLSKGY